MTWPIWDLGLLYMRPRAISLKYLSITISSLLRSEAMEEDYGTKAACVDCNEGTIEGDRQFVYPSDQVRLLDLISC